MKKRFILGATYLSTILLLTGCLGLSIGSGEKTVAQKPTVGQQLIDLKRARDTGAITEAEYNSQKTKVLENK